MTRRLRQPRRALSPLVRAWAGPALVTLLALTAYALTLMPGVAFGD